MVLKEFNYWVGESEKEIIAIYEYAVDEFTAFHIDRKKKKTQVLKCKGCDIKECVKTVNKVFNAYTCIEN